MGADLTDEHGRCFVEGGWYRPDELAEVLAYCWFPIETAPRDGTLVLIWTGALLAFAVFRGAEWYGRDIYGRSGAFAATHWMPLPAQPGRTR